MNISRNEKYRHKKRSTAVLQPLLTLNLILRKTHCKDTDSWDICKLSKKKSMFYNTSYIFSPFAISFLRISAFSFLIHEAFDALLGGFFKFLKVYLHFGYLAVCRQ